MQFIIFDPLLKNTSGHVFFYDTAVLREVKKKKIPVVILGNRAANTDCLAIEGFLPYLDDIINKVFSATVSFRKIVDVVKFFKEFINSLDDCFLREKKVSINNNDIIFVPNAYIFELLCLGWFFFIRHSFFKNKNFKILIVLRYRFIRNSLLLTILLKILYWFTFNVFFRRFGEKVIYFTDSELLQKEYSILLDSPIHLCPIPVYPLPKISEEKINFLKKIVNNKTVISFLGGARLGRGFDILVEAISFLLKDVAIKDKIFFIIQIDIHPQSYRDLLIVEKSATMLEDLARNNYAIKLLKGSLNTEDYYAFLSQSHIVLLPYRTEVYKSTTANVLIETVLMGNIPVVSDNTWMSNELKKYGVRQLFFNSNEVKELVHTVKNIIPRIGYYQTQLSNVRKIWQGFHTAEKLVELLLKDSIKLEA